MEAHPVAAAEQLRKADEYLPNPGQGAKAAPELGACQRRIIKRDCLRIENHSISLEEATHRQHGVVRERIRRDGRGQFAPYRVDASGGIENRIDSRMLLAGPDLVAPVQVHVSL